MGLTKALHETEPFSQLPAEAIAELTEAAILRQFPPQTVIFNQHDPPTGFLYLIKEGLVEILVLTPGGVEIVVDYRKEGSFFGGTPVFTGETYTAGARTVKGTECYLLPQEVLAKTAKHYPHITEHFTRAVLSRVRSLYAELVNEHNQNALTRMEAFPFRKRLSELMSAPLTTCSATAPVTEIAQRMTEEGIGAIIIQDDTLAAAGIVTQHDLVSKVLTKRQVGVDDLTAADVMTPNPFTLPPDAYMYEAMAFMMGHKIKHLPIRDRNELVGIVTWRDLMRFRSDKSLLLVGQVKEARTLEALAEVKSRMLDIAKALQGETHSHFETMEILSHIHHCIMQRCFELLLEEMRREGLHPPDIRFCLIIMGSGGRKEMLLGPDQDHGLIYENFPDSRTAEVEAFFAPFTARLVKNLHAIGYPLCNGKVMADNPCWRGRLRDWQARVATWIHAPEPKRVMYSTIFLDFMPLVGDATLCQDLRETLHREVRKNPIFLYYLLKNDLNLKSPLNLLGRFVVEKDGEYKGKVSLKTGGSVFIVDCVRIFLLEKGVDATTTVERLDALVQLNVFNQETAEHFKAALEAFTFLRLRNEIALIEQGAPPSHYIAPHSLKKNEQDLLREAFRVAIKLQDVTKRHFSVF